MKVKDLIKKLKKEHLPNSVVYCEIVTMTDLKFISFDFRATEEEIETAIKTAERERKGHLEDYVATFVEKEAVKRRTTTLPKYDREKLLGGVSDIELAAELHTSLQTWKECTDWKQRKKELIWGAFLEEEQKRRKKKGNKK